MKLVKIILLASMAVFTLGCGWWAWELTGVFTELEVNDPTLEHDPDFCPIHGYDHAQD